MPGKTTEDLLEVLFSQLNNLLMPTDTTPGAPAPKGFLSLMLPGLTVRPQDFDPATPEGRKNLYLRMDQIPAVNKQYLTSGRTCSDLYKKILSAQTPEDDSERAKAMAAKYDAARAYLKGPEYKDYKRYRDDYYDARDDYLTAQNETELSAAQHDKAVKRAKRTMEDAMDDWLGLGNKREVEDALATCATYLAFTPKTVFADAGKLFESAKDEQAGYPVLCTPGNWALDPDALSWTDVVIKQGTSMAKTHHDVKSIDSSFSACYASGPWHASASGGYHDRTEQLNKSSTVDKLGLAFQVARVEIGREWFSSALLTYGNVTVPGQWAGSICAGSLAKAGQCDFPFLPTAFVVARNINIYNEFSSEEEKFFQQAQSWSAHAQIGYGPFSLGSDTSSSRDLSDQEKKEFGNAVKMTVGQGMQLIGFLNTVLTPAFPGTDDAFSTMEVLQALCQNQLGTR